MMVNTFIGIEKSPQRIGTNTQQKIHVLKLWAGEQKTTLAFKGAESSYHGCLKLSSLLGEGLPKIQQ